jgi:hypothetical protein
MKYLIFFLFLSLTSFEKSFAQNVRSIRFIYQGEELKPHGTLVISLGQRFVPFDKPPDSIFGKGIQTDTSTFNFIEKFVHKNRHVSRNTKTLSALEADYKILLPSSIILFLSEKYFKSFFYKLANELKEEHHDKFVVEAFRFYYCGWRNPNSQ